MKSLEKLGFPQYFATVDGRIFSAKSERFLKPSTQKSGYHTVSLSGKTVYVHRLILAAFTEENPDMEANHINGVKSDNRLCNLEWATPKQNSVHAIRKGLNPVRKHSEDLIHKVCSLLEDGWRNKDISTICNLSSSVISGIRSGSLYEYISCEYKITSRKNTLISPESVYRVCSLLSQKLTPREISEISGVSEQTIRNIKCRRIHRKISINFEW